MSFSIETVIFCDICSEWITAAYGQKAAKRRALVIAKSKGWITRGINGKLCHLCPRCASGAPNLEGFCELDRIIVSNPTEEHSFLSAEQGYIMTVLVEEKLLEICLDNILTETYLVNPEEIFHDDGNSY